MTKNCHDPIHEQKDCHEQKKWPCHNHVENNFHHGLNVDKRNSRQRIHEQNIFNGRNHEQKNFCGLF
jgi:hypothetical protein